MKKAFILSMLAGLAWGIFVGIVLPPLFGVITTAIVAFLGSMFIALAIMEYGSIHWS